MRTDHGFHALTGLPDLLPRSLVQITTAKGNVAGRTAAWFLQKATESEPGAGFGIRMKWDNFRAPRDPELRYFVFGGARVDGAVAAIFPDGSLLAGEREPEGDLVRLVPWIFALRSKPLRDDVQIKVRFSRSGTPSLALESRENGYVCKSVGQGGLETFWYPPLNRGLDNLARDLDEVVLAPASMPFLERPDPDHPGLQRGTWPAFLPHRRFSSSDRDAVADWFQDITDWAALIFAPKIGAMDMARLRPRATLLSALPGEPLPQVSFYDGIVRVVGRRHADVVVRAGMRACPPPVDPTRLTGLSMERGYGRRTHAAHRCQLAVAEMDTISAHRKMALMRRFGPGVA